MSLLNRVTVGLAAAPRRPPPEQITLTVETSSARPTPEQLANALLTKLGVSAADRAALAQANGGGDLREQLIAASLGKLAPDKAYEVKMEKAAKPLNLTPTGDKDPAAIELAARIGGMPSVKIEGYGDREFDAVSDKYIGQTTNSVIATKSPSNYLNPSKKAQLRETLRVAAETGRTALFEFTAGTPSLEVADFIERNAKRMGARYEITVRVGGEK